MRIRHIKGAEDMLAAAPLVIDDPALFRGCWREKVFGNDRPLFLEIGTGMGTFIRENALAHPETDWLGLEMNSTVLLKAVNRYEKRLLEKQPEADSRAAETEAYGSVQAEGTAAGPQTAGTEAYGPVQAEGTAAGSPAAEAETHSLLLKSNLRFLWSDARLLEEFFAPGEISRIYLNFSDPWPKPKNANKRLTSPAFLERYGRVLEPGGRIEFKTDNRDLFDYSVETAEREGWSFLAKTFDLHHDAELCRGNIMTEYEAKFSAKGNAICKMIIAR